MTAAVAFLLDEHVPLSERNAIIAIEPTVRVKLIGWDSDIPPKETPDPGLLAFAEDNGFALVTFDKRTMATHEAAHLAAGRHTYGVFVFPNGQHMSAGGIAEALILVWATSHRDEWVDRFEYLPY